MEIVEKWRDIENYEGLYQVSNLGNIRSIDRIINYADCRIRFHKGRNIMQALNRQGYLQVSLSNNGFKKTFRVNRLVAEAFIPNPNNLPEVNHKNEDKHNNAVYNLEWCTPKYNCNYGDRNKKISSKIDYKRIGEINKKKLSKTVFQYSSSLKLLRTWDSTVQCSEYGFNTSGISQCCNKKINTYKGFIWSYEKLEN